MNLKKAFRGKLLQDKCYSYHTNQDKTDMHTKEEVRKRGKKRCSEKEKRQKGNILIELGQWRWVK